MSPYGKTASHAIAAMSRLAQVYPENRRLNSAEIAEARDLPQPVVAKVLTVLSQAGLVAGSPGPGGGYRLAKPPGDVTLYDVAELFDRQDSALGCPFGPNYCGVGPQCPLHPQLDRLREQVNTFLRSNTFAVFVGEPEPPATLPLMVPLSLVAPPAE
jgi:Rrf2 family protein